MNAIATRIAEFLAVDEPTLDWLRAAVREHDFLPLYLGWVSVFAIRPDGSFVRWDHEDDPANIKPLLEPYWQRVAICQGVKNYHELRALVPARPASAETCRTCYGTGELPDEPTLICECCGIGWIRPRREPRVASPIARPKRENPRRSNRATRASST